MPNPPAQNATRSESTSNVAMILALALVVAFLVVPVYVGNPAHPFGDQWFAGSDTYMRLVRVQDWWNGGAWYESFSARSNWPEGETLHWTRPFDILLMILAAPFAPFVGMHTALFLAGVAISPILFLATLWVMVWGTKPFLDARGRVILVVLITFQPSSHFYFVAARPDHHSLILFCFAATLTLLVRHAFNPKTEPQCATWAGAAAAFGVWVSIESLSIELFALLALGTLWLWRGEDTWLAALRRFTLVGALFTALAMVVERPPTEWLGSVEFDRLSTVHVVLLALIALGVEGLWRGRAKYKASLFGRLGAAGGASLAAGLVMAALFPDFFKGPFGAAMDPRLDELWLSKIQEFQPLIGTDTTTLTSMIMVLGPIIWLAVYAARSWASGGRDLVLTLAVAVAIFLPLTIVQSRWGAYMSFVVVFAWAMVLQRVLDWQGGPKSGETPLLRVPLFLTVALGHILAASALNLGLPKGEKEPLADCQWRELAPYLNSAAFENGQAQTFLTFIHEGPEVLYRTQHRVIGTPYHRNSHGLLDNFTAFMATDEAESKAILANRGVNYVLTCVGTVEEQFFLTFEGDTLVRKIVAGTPPAWLTPAPLPNDLGEKFHLYRFKNGTP